VTLGGLEFAALVSRCLWANDEYERHERLMQAVDWLNDRFGVLSLFLKCHTVGGDESKKSLKSAASPKMDDSRSLRMRGFAPRGAD
jgi:hypothetical protein